MAGTISARTKFTILPALLGRPGGHNFGVGLLGSDGRWRSVIHQGGSLPPTVSVSPPIFVHICSGAGGCACLADNYFSQSEGTLCVKIICCFQLFV